MDMSKEDRVLCVANAYEKKYYFNQRFETLPLSIRQELQIMCVLFTEEVGGIFSLVFGEEGGLLMEVSSEEGDLLYDEIGSGLKVKQYRQEKKELFETLELYYQTFFLKKGKNVSGKN